MGSEYELKFQADPRILEDVLRSFPGEIREYAMETTYYDTPDGAFSRLYYTLRRRMENGKSVCTLKTPGEGGAREEWEVLCPDIREALPQIQALGAPAIPTGEISPICGAKFLRRTKMLTYNHSTAELACDLGILTGGGKEQGLCEIEIELKSGSRQDINALGRELAERFSLRMEPDSKFARAQRLYKGGQAC